MIHTYAIDVTPKEQLSNAFNAQNHSMGLNVRNSILFQLRMLIYRPLISAYSVLIKRISRIIENLVLSHQANQVLFGIHATWRSLKTKFQKIICYNHIVKSNWNSSTRKHWLIYHKSMIMYITSSRVMKIIWCSTAATSSVVKLKNTPKIEQCRG